MENGLIINRDVIMVGLQPWDLEIGGNFKNMAFQIARQNRVLYVNKPLDRKTALTSKLDPKTITRLKSIKKGVGVLKKASINLWVFNPQTMLESINWLPPGRLYKIFNKLNNRRFAKQIKQACNKLGFKRSLLIVDNDFFNSLYLKEYLTIDFSVYYLRDYLLSQPYFYKHGILSEPALMQKVDIVTTNSSYLAEYAQKYNTNSFYIGQGCEFEVFEKKTGLIPTDIADIPKPIIGYCGALLSIRLDIDLLLSIATEKPQWSIVLIGPEDDGFKKSALHHLKNVYFLGHKEPHALPDYVHCFDVCLNPQLVNEMTIGNYPRKIDEYLAAGKPVVATATKAMEEFESCTYLCNDLNDYLLAIEKILASQNDAGQALSRIEVAKSHTWENSIIKLYTAINNHQNKQ